MKLKKFLTSLLTLTLVTSLLSPMVAITSNATTTTVTAYGIGDLDRTVANPSVNPTLAVPSSSITRNPTIRLNQLSTYQIYQNGATWNDDTHYLAVGNRDYSGCAAFAFSLNDGIFGRTTTLAPRYNYTKITSGTNIGKIRYKKSSNNRFYVTTPKLFVNVGDIVDMADPVLYPEGHYVVVYKKSTTGIYIIEGNNGGKVVWNNPAVSNDSFFSTADFNSKVTKIHSRYTR